MRYLLSLALLACLPGLARAGSVPNGDFDTGIAGWTYSGDPTGSISWEPTDGSPQPGSLRLFSPGPGGLFEVRSTACANIAPGQMWAIESQVKRVGNIAGCSLQALVYLGTDCTGIEGEVEPRAFAVGPSDTWLPVSLTAFDYSGLGGSISFRLLLERGPSVPGAASCLFDSVRLYQTNQSVVEVPAVDTPGLAALTLLLAIAAHLMLRRR